MIWFTSNLGKRKTSINGKKNVSRIEITMDDGGIMGMEILESLKDVPSQFLGNPPTESCWMFEFNNV